MSRSNSRFVRYFFKILKYCDLGTYASGTKVLKLILNLHVIEAVILFMHIGYLAIYRMCCRKSIDDVTYLKIIFTVALVLKVIAQIYTLWKGIKLRSKGYLRWHLIIKLGLLIPVHVLIQEVSLKNKIHWLNRILDLTQISIRIFIHIYGGIMVWKYHRKLDSPLMSQLNDYCYTLRSNERSSKTTDADMNEYDGIIISNGAVIVTDPPVKYKAFRRHVLSPWDVTVDPFCVLGEGQFGKVFKGTFTVNKKSVPIAAKVSKNVENTHSFSTLLQEMKVIIHVGKHENVIRFFGVTSDASVKEHFAIITAYCDNGCLDEFLKQHRHTFVDIAGIGPDSVQIYANLNEHGSHSKLDLIRFGLEIARGMKHLVSKGTIHGDLACRNCLLTSNLTIKLTDFGMARRLYNYQTYTTGGQQSCMPWRWMSIEAIEDLRFSEKSDVYAYGVTLWEIFTLGGFPFEKINWSPNIPFQLRNQLRLEKPRYASDQIYEIMKTCWEFDSDQRPGFNELTATFEEIMKIESPNG